MTIPLVACVVLAIFFYTRRYNQLLSLGKTLFGEGHYSIVHYWLKPVLKGRIRGIIAYYFFGGSESLLFLECTVKKDFYINKFDKHSTTVKQPHGMISLLVHAEGFYDLRGRALALSTLKFYFPLFSGISTFDSISDVVVLSPNPGIMLRKKIGILRAEHPFINPVVIKRDLEMLLPLASANISSDARVRNAAGDCANCGHLNEKDANFCEMCRNPL